jgi:hypothetical protein
MRRICSRVIVIVVCLLSLSALASAQGASSSITGVVSDTAGGVVPGAAVVVTSNATGTKYQTITNANGAFNVPALPAGSYTVTVSLQGFKSAVVTDVRVQIGAPTTIKPVLEVGTLAETVTVTGGGCIQRFAGECTPRNVLIRAPWFTRVDIGLTKRFPLSGAMNFEVRADVLNLFDNVNFNPSANPGGGATIFQVGSAYRDPDNNFDPGGRLGQLSVRFNW